MIVLRSVSASRVPAPRAAGFAGLIAVSACLCPARACLGLPGRVIPPALPAARAGSIGLFLRRGLLRERLNGYLFLVLKKRYPDGVFRPGAAACSGCWAVVRLSGERVVSPLRSPTAPVPG